MITRSLEKEIGELLFKGKAILLIGPRQTGKSTLIKTILQTKFAGQSLFLDGDDPTVARLLNRPNTEQLRQLIGRNTLVFIDEAQRIPDIGITSKIIVDQLPGVQLILSGSSAFELNQHTQEPLTGRKYTFHLFPVSWNEWQQHEGFLVSEQDLENRLVYGFYPDVLNNKTSPSRILKELTESYLYKDVLMYAGLKKPEVLQKLLQALAYQVGSEVSMRELGEVTGLDPKTVSSYIDVLEKAFVVFRLPSFSRNHRNEIKAGRKIYFYDNGVRNTLVGQLTPLAARQDVGALWENFLVSERRKQLFYTGSLATQYFWRTAQQQEVDYVEDAGGDISGYEFKWNPRRTARFPLAFTQTYAAKTMVVSRDNFREFIGLAR